MLVALDNNCPGYTVQRLKRLGHEVVYLARHEADEDWVDEALRRGAEIFISNDLDIANLLDRWNSDADYVELPKRVSGERLVKFIVDAVLKSQARRANKLGVVA